MDPKTRTSRRGFLRGVGAAGAAGAVAAATTAAVPRAAASTAATPDTGATADAPGKGYRLTDHVRRYYRSTSF